MLKAVNPEIPSNTLSSVAYSELREDIVHGRHAPGSRLRIDQLTKQYGVGATPLREALNRLAAEGFVISEGQRGFRATDMSVEDLHDLTELRISLDNIAMRQSILSGDEEWESRVVAAFYRLSKVERAPPSERTGWDQRNREFHKALTSACDSIRLHRFYDILYDQHKRYRNLCRSEENVSRDVHSEHQAIYDAALARDADKAVLANEVHIRRTLEITSKVLQARMRDPE